jgi:hypothetical protein
VVRPNNSEYFLELNWEWKEACNFNIKNKTGGKTNNAHNKFWSNIFIIYITRPNPVASIETVLCIE